MCKAEARRDDHATLFYGHLIWWRRIIRCAAIDEHPVPGSPDSLTLIRVVAYSKTRLPSALPLKVENLIRL